MQNIMPRTIKQIMPVSRNQPFNLPRTHPFRMMDYHNLCTVVIVI